MKITTAQVFMIGAAAIPFAGAVAVTMHWGDPTAVAQLVAAGTTFWAATGAALTKPSDQVQSVVARIDTPDVLKAVVPAVSELPGVDPFTVNSQASPALKAVAEDEAVKKVSLR